MEEYLHHIGANTIRKQDYVLANSYNIQPFSPNDIKEITGGIVAIVAATGSGKTVLLKDILSEIAGDYNKFYLMSRTARLQEAYDFVPRRMITDDFDEELLTEIWNRQVDSKAQEKKIDKVLIVLDDIIASPSYKSSKMLDEIAYGARHCNITLILLSQNMSSIKTSIRNNIRIAVAFQLSSKREREKFVEQFLAAENNHVGDILFRRLTDVKYQCIIVQAYKSGASVEDKVKVYTARPDVRVVFRDKEPSRTMGPPPLIRPRAPPVKKREVPRAQEPAEQRLKGGSRTLLRPGTRPEGVEDSE